MERRELQGSRCFGLFIMNSAVYRRKPGNPPKSRDTVRYMSQMRQKGLRENRSSSRRKALRWEDEVFVDSGIKIRVPSLSANLRYKRSSNGMRLD
ncbi:unnamed protein product [Gongylonema pulchrum]|uniref:Transposase n=1 Tax=Gongylonema pulchrum TaxID=637853 RepID=A0A183EAY3_9BILA|nr:unnamed protein product [Gongylonema pulchrum]